MGDNEKAKEPEIKEKKVKKRKYYAKRRAVYHASVPVLDENGKRVERKDAFGRPMMNKNGTPMFAAKIIEFNPGQSNVKLGTYCTYETSDPSEIEHFDKRCADGTSCVVTEAKWKKDKNPAAFEMEMKMKEMQEGKLTAEKNFEEMKAKGASQDEVIARFKKTIEELKAKGK